MRTTLTAVLALAAAFVTPLAGLLEAQSAPLGAGTAQSARQAFGPLAADDPDLAARIDTMALRAHTRFLADDALAGRGAGTTGERVAAAYIASRLATMGLTGAGDEGAFRLPVPLRAAAVDPATRMTVRPAGGPAVELAHDRAFVLNTGGADAFRDFAGRVILAGEPGRAAETLRGMDLRDRVVAVNGPLGAAAMELVPAWIEAGVAGVLLLVPDPGQFQLYVRSRGDTRYYVDADVGDPVWQPDLPVVIAGPDATAALLAGSGFDAPPTAGDLGAGGAGGPDAIAGAARALETVVELDAELEHRDLPGANVAGILPGSDPSLRDEYVVYTAHYDHLGVSVPDETGDSIYNGFSDNAAGVAMLLAIADAMRQDPPARSVLFLFLGAEERGLLGASHAAAFPPVPLDRIRALINLDAGAPPAPPVSWRVAGGQDSPLGALAESVARDRGWNANLTPGSPNSDYWPFLARGVPAVFLIPGDEWENTSPAERDALRRRWDRYHQAGDHYHPEFPFTGLQRYAEYGLALGLRAADG